MSTLLYAYVYCMFFLNVQVFDERPEIRERGDNAGARTCGQIQERERKYEGSDTEVAERAGHVPELPLRHLQPTAGAAHRALLVPALLPPAVSTPSRPVRPATDCSCHQCTSCASTSFTSSEYTCKTWNWSEMPNMHFLCQQSFPSTRMEYTYKTCKSCN